MWDWLSGDLQNMIISHLDNKPSYYKVGLDTDWGQELGQEIDNFEPVLFPRGAYSGGFTLMSTYVVIRGFISEGKLAFKFDELKSALLTCMFNEFDIDKNSTTFCIDFVMGKVCGIFTDRTLFSKHCAISKQFLPEDLFSTDCLLDLKSVNMWSNPALFLTVEVERSFVLEALLECRDRDSAAETSPLIKSIVERVKVENGRERFVCETQDFCKLLAWCSSNHQEPQNARCWSSDWKWEFYVNEDNEVAYKKARYSYLFLTVEEAKPRVVEAILYCRNRDSAGETSPIFKSICGRVEVENGRERFYCELESFGKLLVWCSDEMDARRWTSKWDIEFYLNEDNEIAVNEATEAGSWTVIGAIENNEIWIHIGDVELWDCNENDEGCDFVCEIRGSAARKWWRILRLAIKICKILCS